MPKINLSVSVTTPTGTTPVRHVPDVWPSLLPSTVAYELYGLDTNLSFNLAEAIAECQPIYEDMPGWTESTVGVEQMGLLPLNARRYLDRMEELCGVPVDMVSTGPDRRETIVLRHPFEV